MTLERLYGVESPFFDIAFALYEQSFPVYERRDSTEQARALKNSNYHFDIIKEDGDMLGIMFYWELDDLIFLEHFATQPHLRGKGIGVKALELLKSKGKSILLEIEPPQDEITIRRFGFYKRCGFVLNSHYHIQAKYHLGDEDCELKILSFPEEISKEQYMRFYEYMTREIGIAPNKSSDFTVRSMNDSDDACQVAKLIYLTDPYIYPGWFDTIEQGIRVIKEMINLDTLYNRKNIKVAVDKNNFVAGVLVGCDSPFTESFDEIKKAFALANVEIDDRSRFIFDNYYALMGEDEGHYIANVAVDPDYRKRGIAALLVDSKIKNKDVCTLECVKANAHTWRLYQRLGFKIEYEYPGVFGVPCYKMTYRR